MWIRGGLGLLWALGAGCGPPCEDSTCGCEVATASFAVDESITLAELEELAAGQGRSPEALECADLCLGRLAQQGGGELLELEHCDYLPPEEAAAGSLQCGGLVESLVCR